MDALYGSADRTGSGGAAVVVQASLRVGHRVIERLGDDAEPERFLVEVRATDRVLGAGETLVPLFRTTVHFPQFIA